MAVRKPDEQWLAAARYADQIAEIYEQAEQIMLVKIARRLERGIEDAGWAEAKLAEVAALRSEILGEAKNALKRIPAEVRKAIMAGAEAGGAQAAEELKAAGVLELQEVANLRRGAGIGNLARETVGALGTMNRRILRTPIDIYRSVVADAAAQILTGTQTLREAAQAALNRFADAGVTGFVDAAGRKWDMVSYAKMAVRTGAHNARIENHLDKLKSNGRNLVIVSAHGATCPKCAPWERAILAIEGPAEPPARATVDEAESQGLKHPNCLHRYGLYVPGIEYPEGPEYAPEIYKAEQQRNYVNRQVRKWRNRKAAGLSDEAKKSANARLRELYAQRKELTAKIDGYWAEHPIGGAGGATSSAGITATGGGGGTSRPPKPPTGRGATGPLQPPDDWKNAVEAHQAALIPDVASYHDLDVEQYKAKCTERIRSLLADGQPCIRVRVEALEGVLEDGRFKNQFETGISGGAYAPDLRRKVEANVFGLKNNTPATKRPIYGFIGHKEHDEYSGVSQYGDVTVRLRPGMVEKKMTATFGDSADCTDWGRRPTLLPMPPDRADYRIARHSRVNSPLSATSLDVMTRGYDSTNYIEAQFKSLSIDDIEEVVFHDSARYNALREQIEARGLSCRMVRKRQAGR